MGSPGYRQLIVRDASGRIERHFVILPFAARWLAGEIALNDELAEGRWREPTRFLGSKTTTDLQTSSPRQGKRLPRYASRNCFNHAVGCRLPCGSSDP